MGSAADYGNSSGALLSPVAHGQGNAAAAVVTREGVTFTVTEGNEVAEVVVGGGGAARVLDSESFFDAATGMRRHFVDVQGQAEAMLFFVSVNEDQRRIVEILRLF
ncbi:unnamed protein product [Urochloa humidicola]